ncbi:putative hydrolase [Enhygromyxa salina]|uniref:Putative hydrolase n=1 Tax=Enhygromyxa salina TaxID=215803 RepID=A0A2S9XKD1_9BACT|nr:dienelactone hydrolase family protein [Enhygromyxa salina]PRP93313.1 putative hydrolase [Enhygromyxa salina]
MRHASATIGAILVVMFAGACRAAPQPSEPAPRPAPAAEPAPVDPEPEPEPERWPEPELELEQIAGVHYLEVVTGDADADAELPMVVALHGNGAFPRLMEAALLQNPGDAEHPAAPYDAPARFIFLRGTEAVDPPGHARWFSITANEAQASAEQLAELSAQIEARSNTVADAIAALTEARPTVGKPIITGHSQGGILTFGLAVSHPEQFAAAFPVAGWLPAPLWPKQPANEVARKLRIVALHGADDTTVSFIESEAAVEALAKLGYDITLHPYPGVRHSFSPMLAELRALLERA